MSRRTILDVANLIRDRIPGYSVATETWRDGSGAIVVTWSTCPRLLIVVGRAAGTLRWVEPGPVSQWQAPYTYYTGRGWPERMARDIVAVVREDARRNGRWGADAEEVSR